MTQQYRKTISELVKEINDEELLKIVCKILWKERDREIGKVY